MPENIDIKIGDYIIYNDGRDNYAGTVVSIDEIKETASIKVILTVKDQNVFATIEAPLRKLKKRSLL